MVIRVERLQLSPLQQKKTINNRLKEINDELLVVIVMLQ